MKISLAVLLILVLAIPAFAWCQDGGWGNLKGQILVSGAIPEIEREVIDKDQPSCLADRELPLDDNLIVGRDRGLKDAFVMMFRDTKDALPPEHPDYAQSKLEPVILDNRQCRFEPHALFVRTGQTLRMKNSDDVGHNCHITLFNNEENVNIPISEHVDVKLNEIEKVPGNVVCDIHRWMDAVLLVRDEPYVAITDANGKFEIRNVPAGTWKFQFWHRRLGYMKQLEVSDRKVGRRGEIEITINNGETLDLGSMELDGASFRKK